MKFDGKYQIQHNTVYNENATKPVGSVFATNVVERGIDFYIVDIEGSVHRLLLEGFNTTFHEGS